MIQKAKKAGYRKRKQAKGGGKPYRHKRINMYTKRSGGGSWYLERGWYSVQASNVLIIIKNFFHSFFFFLPKILLIIRKKKKVQKQSKVK
jgi:hypothetical protein